MLYLVSYPSLYIVLYIVSTLVLYFMPYPVSYLVLFFVVLCIVLGVVPSVVMMKILTLRWRVWRIIQTNGTSLGLNYMSICRFATDKVSYVSEDNTDAVSTSWSDTACTCSDYYSSEE